MHLIYIGCLMLLPNTASTSWQQHNKANQVSVSYWDKCPNGFDKFIYDSKIFIDTFKYVVMLGLFGLHCLWRKNKTVQYKFCCFPQITQMWQSTHCSHWPCFGVSFSQVYLCVVLALCCQLSGPVHHKQTWADVLDSKDISFRFLRNIWKA